jgi:hypothetical protein
MPTATYQELLAETVPEVVVNELKYRGLSEQ